MQNDVSGVFNDSHKYDLYEFSKKNKVIKKIGYNYIT